MTKAEARRILRCKNDAELSRALYVERSTVRRWPKLVPVKYRTIVRIIGERLDATTKMAESVPF